MNTSPPRPIEKNVVLVGAGNAHLVFVRRFRMAPIPGVAVTLINDGGVVPYSAMVPGHVGGDYKWEEITVDLVRLCASANVRLIAERADQLDSANRRVLFADRPAVPYDALSLGLGSLPACPPEMCGSKNSLFMRPMARFVERLIEVEQQLQSSPRPFHFVVVGGGASGCELSFAIHKRLGKLSGFRLTLIQGNDRLLPSFSERAAATMLEILSGRGVIVRLGTRVIGGNDTRMRFEDGEEIAYDAVLWATNAAPPRLLQDCPLAKDAGGFLLVEDTLQSVGDPAVFGTGDCVSFLSNPGLAKNGVHAVREGAVLFDNLAAYVNDRSLRPFRPQRAQLALLNTGDGNAMLTYGPMSATGRVWRILKDRIDRAWIRKFVPAIPAATEEESPLMRCGGCGSKISGDVLSAVLRRLEIPDDPGVLLGCKAGEDAAVFRLFPVGDAKSAGLVEVQTVDFFRAFVADPYLFGRIAALHSVSDLHAMNARPRTALAIVTLPFARGPVQEAMLFELLSGALRTFRELGVTLAGGHTTEATELAVGFSITGVAEESRLFRKGALKPGDKLVLTKPIGTGALLAAWMRGQCKAEWFEEVVAGMLESNQKAGAVFAASNVTACTDITGFGLAGHLLEMLDASGVGAKIDAGAVPLYPGFNEVVAGGIVSTLQRDNVKLACRIEGESQPAWLFDPQTSGGLLAGVDRSQLSSVLGELPGAAVVGEVVAGAAVVRL